MIFAMIFAAIAHFGSTSYVAWEFGGGVLAFLLVAVLVATGVGMVRRLVNSA